METRSINNLLIILRDHIQNQESLNSGICLVINILCSKSIINFNEYNILTTFMSKNRPKRGEHYNKEYRNCSWWWPTGKKEPRIAWLNSKIKI